MCIVHPDNSGRHHTQNRWALCKKNKLELKRKSKICFQSFNFGLYLYYEEAY
jgi:hypothetical protein